jgi:hypothetical protein
MPSRREPTSLFDIRLKLEQGRISGPEDVPNSVLRKKSEQLQIRYPKHTFAEALDALLHNCGHFDSTCDDLADNESYSESSSESDTTVYRAQGRYHTRQQARSSAPVLSSSDNQRPRRGAPPQPVNKKRKLHKDSDGTDMTGLQGEESRLTFLEIVAKLF